MIIYPIGIFNNKKIKYTGLIISLLIIIVMTFITFANKTTYNTTILVSDSETGEVFDDSYKVYLGNDKLGKVYIEYDENVEDYSVIAEFKRAGKTNLVLEDTAGNKTISEIKSKVNNFDNYDTIFIGYPIWWGDLPRIIYTFIEEYDFTGRTIIPFNTHEGSGLSGVPR